MLHAGHREVEPALAVERSERDVVEAVDVDDQIERLPQGQEIREHDRFLRLLVPFMGEAERHDVLVPEEGMPLQGVDEAGRADLTEPDADRPAEDADEELVAAGLPERIVVGRGESEVVGPQALGHIAPPAQWLGNVERHAGSMCEAEVGVHRFAEDETIGGRREQVAIFLAMGVEEGAGLGVVRRKSRPARRRPRTRPGS